jgi:hypothetical protein
MRENIRKVPKLTTTGHISQVPTNTTFIKDILNTVYCCTVTDSNGLFPAVTMKVSWGTLKKQGNV